jgi:steroid delta-isomerase-like uncharacterized protein
MEKPSLVTILFAAYNAGDLAAVEALYAAEATHEDVALGHPKHGPKDIAAGLAYFLGRFPDARWTLRGHVDGPSSSTGWYQLRGTLQSDFGKISACGQELDLRGVIVFTHDGGRITSTADYWDMHTFQRQMNSSGLDL